MNYAAKEGNIYLLVIRGECPSESIVLILSQSYAFLC